MARIISHYLTFALQIMMIYLYEDYRNSQCVSFSYQDIVVRSQYRDNKKKMKIKQKHFITY